LLVSNNDWQDNAAQVAEIAEAGLQPPNTLESAIFANLAPGVYTALLAGLNNIRLRFRIGTDEKLAAPGVRVDDISITNASCP
jgi:hypothetical protein